MEQQTLLAEVLTSLGFDFYAVGPCLQSAATCWHFSVCLTSVRLAAARNFIGQACVCRI